MLNIPVGGVARVVVDAAPARDQDATVLALLVANGTLDIVAVVDFEDARTHRQIHDELRQADLARQDKRAGGGIGMQAELAGLRAEVADLKAALPKKAPAKADLKAALPKKAPAKADLKAALPKNAPAKLG